ncbi:MAG: PaaI family thioesterase, partial [Candidatus Marinimicrobia bacterium]|nr:PaaI family thioesterase [Candidatus Neomarinimicrobiota bacterium]
MEIRDNNKCFVCGSDNERGLKLSFKVGDGKANTEFISPPHLQGYDGILHGGIISTILDEVMVKATGEKVVTVELTVKFLKPIP